VTPAIGTTAELPDADAFMELVTAAAVAGRKPCGTCSNGTVDDPDTQVVPTIIDGRDTAPWPVEDVFALFIRAEKAGWRMDMYGFDLQAVHPDTNSTVRFKVRNPEWTR
jgi:hypothetical protein